MAYSDIRDALETRLGAIAGVENVQGYHRLVSTGVDDPTFRGLFVNGSNDLHAWRFTRTAVSQVLCGDDDDTIKRTHTIEIEGYRGIVDGSASENTFQDLLDVILDDLNTGDRTLGGVAITHSLPQAGRIFAVSFYNVLCHAVTITLQVEENV